MPAATRVRSFVDQAGQASAIFAEHGPGGNGGAGLGQAGLVFEGVQLVILGSDVHLAVRADGWMARPARKNGRSKREAMSIPHPPSGLTEPFTSGRGIIGLMPCTAKAAASSGNARPGNLSIPLRRWGTVSEARRVGNECRSPWCLRP